MKVDAQAQCRTTTESPVRREWLIITPEYPPHSGGVSDYTHLVALALTEAGDDVYVWGPTGSGDSSESSGVFVSDGLGAFGPADLRRTGRALNRFTRPRRLMVQWVPHGYGFLSVNVPFCLWLWARALFRGDQIDIVVHEPCLALGGGSWRQTLVAVVHRFMTAILLRAACQVWITIPAWEARWRPFAFGRRVPFQWLPVPSNIPVNPDHAAVARARECYLPGKGFLLGHFGTHGAPITSLLEEILPLLLDRHREATLLLIGSGSEKFREKLLIGSPVITPRVHATGSLDPDELSSHLGACDLMLQPYPDGISSRRTSAMAAMAHGTPMVTTSGHLTEDFWVESGVAAIAPAREPVVFVETVSRLLADSAARSRMSTRSIGFYAEKFDIRHIVKTLRGSIA